MALPDTPNSRKETYLAAIAGQAVSLPSHPITREEAYLDEIAKNGGGGGGGGTTNYNLLSNKPQIGGVELSGNKTASDLGLVKSVAGKGLSTNDFTDNDKDIVDGVAIALSGKVDKIPGKSLSTNDFTNEHKTAIATNAEAIAAIKDGTDIDSFADVENALNAKPDWDELSDNITINTIPKKDAGTYTHNGITYVVDDDGRITANGTAATNTNSLLTIATTKFKAGKRYWLTGCPTGGSNNTYFIICGDGTNNVREYGSGVYFTATANDTVIQIVITKGVTATDLVFEPMLVLEKYKNESFIPNIQSNKYLWDNTLHVPAIEGSDHTVLTKTKDGSTNWLTPNGVYRPIGDFPEFKSYDYDDGNISRKCVSFRVILNTDQVFTSVSALRQYAFDNGGIPIQYGAAPLSGYGYQQAFVGTPEFMGAQGNHIRIHVTHCASTAIYRVPDYKYVIVLADRFIKEVVDTVTPFGNNLYLHTVDCITKSNQEYIADEGDIYHSINGLYCMAVIKENYRMVDNFD